MRFLWTRQLGSHCMTAISCVYCTEMLWEMKWVGGRLLSILPQPGRCTNREAALHGMGLATIETLCRARVSVIAIGRTDSQYSTHAPLLLTSRAMPASALTGTNRKAERDCFMARGVSITCHSGYVLMSGGGGLFQPGRNDDFHAVRIDVAGSVLQRACLHQLQSLIFQTRRHHQQIRRYMHRFAVVHLD